MRGLAYSALLLSVLLCACVTDESPPPAPPPAAPAPPAVSAAASPPVGVFWFRDSAERKAIYIETYRAAGAAARSLSAGLAPRSWAVILDIDETILDNSEYEKSVAGVFKQDSWHAWTQQRTAERLPGAKEFIDLVLDQLHGEVILITNRAQTECDATEDNLHSQQIRYDRILCDRAGDQDKNGRFQQVQQGTPGAAPPLNVLLWVGDNIRDFPALSQGEAGDPGIFGVRYFVLPNPMYGSWMANPYQ
jgi:5'-nucleotidase (lipoprotein e(P4) family)